MAKQFDLYRTVDGSLVLVLQSDLLEDLATRAVCLALPDGRGPQTLSALSPVLSAGDLRVRIAPHLVATLTLAELGSQVANFSHERDRIFRSMDMMLSASLFSPAGSPFLPLIDETGATRRPRRYFFR